MAKLSGGDVLCEGFLVSREVELSAALARAPRCTSFA
jgi:hypothetical protein